jgi:hypothetical protein
MVFNKGEISMAVESFGTERDDIQGSRFQKLKMKTDDELRCGVIFFDEDGKKIFLGAKVHTKKDMKTFLCKSSKDKKEICCTHTYDANVPKYHIGCILVVYVLGKDSTGKTKLKEYDLVPWVFWEKTYQKLVSADREFPLMSHDIKLKCTNGEFQTIDVQSCKESIWTSSPDLKKKVLEAAKPLYESISKNLGMDASPSEIKELIGLDVAGSDDAATDVDLGSVVDSIG